MPEASLVQHPVLEVSINGEALGIPPAQFTLITDQGFPSVMATLSYPGEGDTGSPGDRITVSLTTEQASVLFFTGTIYKSYEVGKLRVLGLSDGYKKLCDTKVNPAYRREKAKIILQDTLDAAGIKETSITCPGVELGRFSTARISVARCIVLLIKALEEHGVTGLRYFFDERDVFHFGTGEDTGVNEGEVIAFETGKDIISKGEGYIEVLPLAIRHSRKITIDGMSMETVRTEVRISRGRSRTVLWVKGA
jgi:hypothetical protein